MGSDMGDTWRDAHSDSQERRANNREKSTRLLRAYGATFTEHNHGAHLIVEWIDGLVDFWPGTGKWIDRASSKQGRGVFRLLRFIGLKGANA